MSGGWGELANLFTAVAGLVIGVLGLLLTVSVRFLDRGYKFFFKLFFAVLIAYIIADFFGQLPMISAEPVFALLSRPAIFLEALFASLLMLILTRFLLYCGGVDWRKSVALRVAVGFWLLYLLLLASGLVSPAVFYFGDDNVGYPGPWYPLLMISPLMLMAVNLFLLWRGRAAFSVKERWAFLICTLTPMLSMLLQILIPASRLIVFGTAASALVVFVFILTDQVDHHVRQAEENARQRASVMVLQMRPHFIYNTMMSIYYLCKQDSQKAQKVILDFTSYLRKNFTAIAKEGTIPFKEELEHTRAYLAVELVRHEGRLFVELDTSHTLFRVPPLTLQPIVENAVKHGVDPELDPLYLSIFTREAEGGSEIIVEDTGPGYAPTDDDEPHIALANIRQRLEMMRGGILEIGARANGGTVVKIWIPAGKGRNLKMKKDQEEPR